MGPDTCSQASCHLIQITPFLAKGEVQDAGRCHYVCGGVAVMNMPWAHHCFWNGVFHGVWNTCRLRGQGTGGLTVYSSFFQALFRRVWGLGSPSTASNLPVCWSLSQQQQFLVGSATYLFPWLLSQYLLGFVSPWGPLMCEALSVPLT